MLGLLKKQQNLIPLQLTSVSISPTQLEQRGVRNNNWLNIRFNPNNDWIGQVGQDEGGFVQFEDPQQGVRAGTILLENYGL